MKKINFILLLMLCGFIITICVSKNPYKNPYTGKYLSKNDTILKLEPNTDCTIIQNLYKEAFYTNGKYVIKDNNITITFSNNEQNYYGASTLRGKVEGSKITLYDKLDDKHHIFLKE